MRPACLALAAVVTACSSPTELTFRAWSRYGVDGQDDAFLELGGITLTTLHRDESGRQLHRFAELSPAGAQALDAAVTDVENVWDASPMCPECRAYDAFTFLDSDGTMITTHHVNGVVPAPYQPLEAFAESVFDTLTQCQPNPLYIMNGESCPPPL